jgi:hypothetical protein
VIVTRYVSSYDRYNILSCPTTEPGLATLGSRQSTRVARRRGPNATATRIENGLLRREIARLRAERDAVSRFVAEAEHGAGSVGSLRDIAAAAAPRSVSLARRSTSTATMARRRLTPTSPVTPMSTQHA